MNGIYEEIRLALYRVWTRRWLALGIAWGVCLLGWLIVALIPNSYMADARIFVEPQDMLTGELGGGESAQRRDRERLEKTLTSTDALEQVVRSTALARTVGSEAEMARAVAGLRENIALKAEKVNLFLVTAVLTSGELGDRQTAQLSRDVVARLIDVFRQENLANGRKETDQTVAFLNQEIEKRRESLARAEQARIDFESANLGLLPGSQSASTRASTARSELSQVESQLIQAQSSLAAINGQLAGTPRTISTSVPGGNPAQQALANARAELASMRARGLTDAHPDVRAAKSQIASLEQQARGGSSQSYSQPNPAYASLASMQSERQAQVAALRARKQALEGEIAGLGGQLAAEPGVQSEYDRLTREYNVQKEQYEKLLAQRENVRLRGDMSSEADAVKFRVVDEPAVPPGPSFPNRPLLTIGVLMLGLAAGIGTALALGQLQTSFASPGKLEKASGLPVLGTISEVPSRAVLAWRKRRQRYFLAAAASLPAAFGLLMAVELFRLGGTA